RGAGGQAARQRVPGDRRDADGRRRRSLVRALRPDHHRGRRRGAQRRRRARRLRARHGHRRAQLRDPARPATGRSRAHGLDLSGRLPRHGRRARPDRPRPGRRPGAAGPGAAGARHLDRRRPGAAHGVSRAQRFASVDALRGLTVAGMLLVNTPGDWGHVYAPLLHASWHGCTAADLVFPFFLFVAGVSIALGIVPRVEQGADPRALHRTIASRALRIIALGLLLNLAAWWTYDLPHYRPWGVLQRIGLCFLIAAPLAMHLRPRAQWALAGALLLGW